MAKLRLTLACWDYDRTRALADGSVQAEGIDLNCLNLHVEETFFRMLRNREFDVAEMSLSSYAMSIARDQPAFIAIPVFPSRFFRQSCIFVSSKSGIREPKDLIGKRIGTPEYQMTAPVWIRGILQDEYGVDPASVEYFTGGEEEPGRDEKLKLELPPKFRLTRIGAAQTLIPFLAEIVRVDWRTPAYLLEQIILHEAVHEIRGWNDLRRRLEADRRCFAFFHPALPDEPLIFVEVALMDRMADAVLPVLDAQSTSNDSSRATTAVFYSISNCQPGLRRVARQLPHQERGGRAVAGVSPAQGVLHAVTRPRFRRLARRAAQEATPSNPSRRR